MIFIAVWSAAVGARRLSVTQIQRHITTVIADCATTEVAIGRSLAAVIAALPVPGVAMKLASAPAPAPALLRPAVAAVETGASAVAGPVAGIAVPLRTLRRSAAALVRPALRSALLRTPPILLAALASLKLTARLLCLRPGR